MKLNLPFLPHYTYKQLEQSNLITLSWNVQRRTFEMPLLYPMQQGAGDIMFLILHQFVSPVFGFFFVSTTLLWLHRISRNIVAIKTRCVCMHTSRNILFQSFSRNFPPFELGILTIKDIVTVRKQLVFQLNPSKTASIFFKGFFPYWIQNIG